MNPPEPPRSAPQQTTELAGQHALDGLLHAMQELHARLEYLRLMLRLNRQAD